MKGVILKTDDGIKLFGCLQCSNGSWYNAEGCFKYCNDNKKPKPIAVERAAKPYGSL